MNVNRILQIKGGDEVGALHTFLTKLWKDAGIHAMLLPVESPDGAGVISQVITDVDELAGVNPFAPIMLSNAAAVVGDFLQQQPQGRLAIMLRPCELRALVELQKRRRIAWESPKLENSEASVVIIGVDCPGTLPVQEYTRRAATHGPHALTHEALSFGFEGGLKLEQMRTACQICESPNPHGADITIGTIGLEPRQHIMVIARDEFIDEAYHLETVTQRIATEEEVVLREVAVGKTTNERMMYRDGLCTAETSRYGDLCTLLACFTPCTMCADCLDACPLYEGELTGMLGVPRGQRHGRPLLPELVAVGRWLASCSGCGMCQDACEIGVPLTLLVSALSHRIRRELHYSSGEPAQSLPWRIGNRSNTQRSQEEEMNALPC